MRHSRYLFTHIYVLPKGNNELYYSMVIDLRQKAYIVFSLIEPLDRTGTLPFHHSTTPTFSLPYSKYLLYSLHTTPTPHDILLYTTT